MMDFGLSDGYVVHDGLDQGEHIFYDLLLYEVKKHEQLYGYQMCLRVYAKSSKLDPSNNKTLFFAASVFVNNTIWIGNCLAATQNILNIVSEFFSINDISINTEKTVAIPINKVLKRLNCLLPSLAKAHNDVKFFSNVVLRKAITKKQFLYLVSAVLQPIIYYRLQFSFASKGVCENMALHHPELYGLKSFEQVLSENGSLDVKVTAASHSASTKFFHDIGFTFKHLLAFKHGSVEVYTNGSVKDLGLIGACSSTAAYFLRANASISVKVLGLLSLTLVELQAIVLALECVPIKKEHIHQIKEHFGIVENEQMELLANVTVFFKSLLPLDMSYYFFRVEDRSVSGNACHFIRNLFDTYFRCSACVVEVGDAGKVNASKSYSIWHPDGRICSSYTILSYEISALSPAGCHKKEIHDDNAKKTILFSIRKKWCKVAGKSAIRGKVIYSLCEAKLSNDLYMLLAKRFVLKSWLADAIQCLGSASGSCMIVDLVRSFTECYRSDIWLSAAKLSIFYEKHGLLPCDESVVPSVASLSDFWTVDVICSLSIRLGIHVSFDLCPHIAGLGLGFLCNILLIDSVSV
ncbi:hypothetical protein G9A89_013697 [Geosiphon pyriformis]|nr:hypothetical protein G9A89_013697 [Geosiphon pyriformis]